MPRQKRYRIITEGGNYKQWIYQGGNVTLIYNNASRLWDVYHNGSRIRTGIKRRRVANLLAQRIASHASKT